MALEHHSNHKMRFDQQVENTKTYVIPFIQATLPIRANLKVLEIGCGEGGVLLPFYQVGCKCIGVDLDQARIELAQEFLKDEIATHRMTIELQNVYEKDFLDNHAYSFDLIILKDVIEHIPNQEQFIPFLKKLLKDKGQVFFGFPPWYMPFGGHQQIAQKKWTSKLPYYHLLPMPIFKWILKTAGESQHIIDTLVEVKETGISIERFEKICQQSGFTIVNKQWYLINPIYKYKFGLNPKKQFWLLGAVPFVRNFLTTCAYYTIEKD
ncbi:MAG TPA: class I SAM-dependent methyltransferase [Chitinophagaceae bacterium]|nr:MAG: type 12 methyltransferase [Bacteroidetes bacterium OLB11]HMN33590.1 class I SAM-dependent methyltransferase [Chitinophagaceae bacterium]